MYRIVVKVECLRHTIYMVIQHPRQVESILPSVVLPMSGVTKIVCLRHTEWQIPFGKNRKVGRDMLIL